MENQDRKAKSSGYHGKNFNLNFRKNRGSAKEQRASPSGNKGKPKLSPVLDKPASEHVLANPTT